MKLEKNKVRKQEKNQRVWTKAWDFKRGAGEIYGGIGAGARNVFQTITFLP